MEITEDPIGLAEKTIESIKNNALLKYYYYGNQAYINVLSLLFGDDRLNIIQHCINKRCNFNEIWLIANLKFSKSQMDDIADDLLYNKIPLNIVMKYAKPEYSDSTMRMISIALVTGAPFEEIEPLLNPVDYNGLRNLFHKYKSSH